jgi:multidrug efflux system outer membrane protein
MRIRNIISTVGLASALTACAVGPNYHAPNPNMPRGYMAGATQAPPGAQTPAEAGPTVDITQWWHALNDPGLDSLIERAIRANPDLEIALTRLQQVRTRQVVYAGDA